MDEKHDIAVLNTLIATTIDSILGYRDSADDVRSTRLGDDFRRFAEARRQVADKLQAEVRRLGGTPEDEGTVKAAAHRRWMDFRQAVTDAKDEAVVTEVRNGEAYLKEKFEAALEDDELSQPVRTLIADCYESVRSGHDRAEALRESIREGAGG